MTYDDNPQPAPIPGASTPSGGAAPPGNGMAVSGFICALVSVVLFWAPGINLVLWILGIVFSAIGLKRANRLGAPHRGLAIAGLVIALVPTLILIIVFFAVIAAA